MQRKSLPALLLVCGLAATVSSFAADDTRLLSFGSHKFDPAARAGEFRTATKTAGGAGLRLVQFTASPDGQSRSALESVGLRVLQYYPHNAYLVWGDEAAASRSSSLPGVRWQGGFSPDWKLSPDLKGRLGKIDHVQVLIYDDGNLPNVLAQIQSFGGTVRQV